LNIDYTSLNLGDTILPDRHAYNAFFAGPSPRHFSPDRFARMSGADLTRKWAENTGCLEPVVIPAGREEGIGMVMPRELTVRKVAEMVGEEGRVEVIDVPTQQDKVWKLSRWVEYYETPEEERDRVRNVMYSR
jgi:F-box and leucine-rich repeat protein 10/11